MNQASFTKEQKLKLYARVNEAGVPLVLTFVNEDSTPYDISAKGFKLEVKKKPNSDDNEFILEEGDGLEVFGADSNKLRITISEGKATIRPATYFYRFFSEDENHTWLADDFFFHEGKFDNVSSQTTSITVSEGGDSVLITISGDTSNTSTRTYTTTSTATLTPDVVNYDLFEITAQNGALVIANPSTDLTVNDAVAFRLTDNGTARAVSFGNKYRAFGAALPTTTTIGKTMYFAAIRNTTDDTYDVTPYIEEQ